VTLVDRGIPEHDEVAPEAEVPDAAEGLVAPAGPNPPGRARGWRSLWAGAFGYLTLSVALWWNVWSSHPTSVTTCGCGDSSLFTWFLEWPAYAMSHGLNPLYSTHLFHPSGVNLLSNTAEIGFGMVLAPVTWVFGPIATLNVALTLSPALSALTMYVLLRRWVSWSPAAFVGGLLYGFSPFIIVSLTDAHLMLGMAAVPPLIVLCLDELLTRQRWRWWVTGLTIGALALVQLSVGTELLVMTAIVAAIGACLVAVYAAVLHRDVLVARAPYAFRATGAAVASSILLLAWPAWFALQGPAHLSGNVWGSTLLSYGGDSFRFLVHPMAPSSKVTALTHQVGGYQAPSLSGQYFGIGLLAVLALGLVIWRRDRHLWLLATVGVVCTFLSLGLSFHGWTLWRLFVRAPLMENVIPSRFVLFTYLCAAAMLGIVIDHVRRATAGRTPRNVGRAIFGWCAGMVVAGVALVPIVSYFADGLPLAAVPVQLPAWFATVAPDLPPNQVLLVFPFAFRQSNMTWQAVDRMRYAMVGGGGPNSLLSRAGKEQAGDRFLAYLSFAGGSQEIVAGEVAAVRSALDGWGVTGIVLPDPKGLAEYDRTAAVRSIVVLTTAATGRAPDYRAHAWVWSGVDRAGPAVNPTARQLASCAEGTADGSVASIQASAACILAQPPAP
jgi:hypothetical protein